MPMFLLVQTVIYVHKNAIAIIKIWPQNATRSGILTLLSHILYWLVWKYYIEQSKIDIQWYLPRCRCWCACISTSMSISILICNMALNMPWMHWSAQHQALRHDIVCTLAEGTWHRVCVLLASLLGGDSKIELDGRIQWTWSLRLCSKSEHIVHTRLASGSAYINVLPQEPKDASVCSTNSGDQEPVCERLAQMKKRR